MTDYANQLVVMGRQMGFGTENDPRRQAAGTPGMARPQAAANQPPEATDRPAVNTTSRPAQGAPKADELLAMLMELMAGGQYVPKQPASYQSGSTLPADMERQAAADMAKMVADQGRR